VGHQHQAALLLDLGDGVGHAHAPFDPLAQEQPDHLAL
jgi:hypothetical protein